MVFGEGRTQGVTRGRNFFHEELGIALTAPQGWRIQNTPAAIAVVNGAGRRRFDRPAGAGCGGQHA